MFDLQDQSNGFRETEGHQRQVGAPGAQAHAAQTPADSGRHCTADENTEPRMHTVVIAEQPRGIRTDTGESRVGKGQLSGIPQQQVPGRRENNVVDRHRGDTDHVAVEQKRDHQTRGERQTDNGFLETGHARRSFCPKRPWGRKSSTPISTRKANTSR